MSRRPGYSSPIGGCFLILFFGVFTAFGGGFIYALIFAPDNVEGSRIVGAIVSSIFFLIGLGGVYAGFRTLFGKPVTGRKPAAGAPSANIAAGGLPNLKKLSPLPSGYYRIPPDASHRAQFFVWLGIGIFWNGIISVFVIAKLNGEGDSPPWWFLAIFLLVGAGLLYAAVKALLRWLMVGETHVDVNRYPLQPGDQFEIRVSQEGRYKIDAMKIDFVCEEKASYRQGTDTRTRTEVVREILISDLPSMTARDGQVLAHQTAEVPPDAMLSFKATNNEINWMLRVKMVIPGRPDVEQKFPVVVMSKELHSNIGGTGY